MFIYIKNWKIVWCSKSWTLSLWEAIEVKTPWYYRYDNWELKYIDVLENLKDSDFFVGERDFNSLYKFRWNTINESEWVDIPDTMTLEEIEKEVEKWDTSWNILLKELNKESTESA